ncbi:early endosome antigen 1 [Patella vulgata]|uniref:early endosome antigen 1 n=1 Tax=Patella vulgata TaxID=6465 RepID=UPI0024A9E2D8|nr:early endosome antigen 1 [Patella vulgata]XP_050414693.2 early endosome antigen 1 [Patella vulgata]
MSETEKLERFTPQHPLPEEIKKMSRDETVCHFCGVSYLIHNEIKKLEERLKATEKELEHYKGSMEREKELKIELEELKSAKSELEQTLKYKESEISSFDVNLKCEKDLTEQLNKQNTEIKTLLNNSKNQCAKYEDVLKQMPAILNEIKQHKSDIEEVRKFLLQREKQTKDELKKLLTDITSRITEQQNDNESLRSKLQCVEMEKMMMSQSTASLTSRLKSQETDVERLKSLQTEYEILTTRLTDLQHAHNKLEEEMSSLSAQNRTISLECQQYKDQIKSKSEERNNLIQQQKHKEQQTQDTINRLQSELKEKETGLCKVHDELKKLESKYHEQQRKEAEMSEKSAFSINETQQLRDQLTRVKKDSDALKAERELMISAHQNRIEDLRESFKKKMAEMDKWPEKLDAAIKQEKIKHEHDLKMLEDKLKENFVMELQIEKEKYKELMSKYQTVSKDKEIRLKGELSEIENKYSTEISQLKKQIIDVRRASTDREDELKREITSLKDIIRDLENRLGKLNADLGDSKNIAELKTQLRHTKSELEDTITDMNKMAENLKNSKQEIQFLQDTVRKECEERFELTEALSDARQELLQLKKPAGGYSAAGRRSSLSTPPKRGSISSVTSHSDIQITEHIKTSPDESNKDISSSNLNLGYKGDVAKPSGKLQGGSVAQNRRRIANILGKKS